MIALCRDDRKGSRQVHYRGAYRGLNNDSFSVAKTVTIVALGSRAADFEQASLLFRRLGAYLHFHHLPLVFRLRRILSTTNVVCMWPWYV